MKLRNKIKIVLGMSFFAVAMNCNIGFAQNIDITQNFSIESEYNHKNFYDELNKSLNDYSKQRLSQYKIIFTDKDIYQYPGYENKDEDTVGVINYNKNEVLIHDYKYDTDSTKHIFYHELGHSIDTYNWMDNKSRNSSVKHGKYSSTPEFQKIFDEEGSFLKRYVVEKYYYDKYSEAFAEVFSIYKSNPDFVERQAPGLYKYMNDIYNQEAVNDGWIVTLYGGSRYLNNGELVKGWFTDPVDGKRYYFDNNGDMKYSTVIDGVSLSPSGYAMS